MHPAADQLQWSLTRKTITVRAPKVSRDLPSEFVVRCSLAMYHQQMMAPTLRLKDPEAQPAGQERDSGFLD